ncbi:MAG: hypothetical protein KH299_08360 [Firmicutes bacterium]|nr:hypothetical protein [Bacillota bacterium]
MDQISPGLQSALASWVNTKNMQPIVDKITPLIWTDINIVNADSTLSPRQSRIASESTTMRRTCC